MKNTLTVKDIVIGDYRTADVFRKWGINYCCGGILSVEDACVLKNINHSDVEKDLQQATRNVQLSNTVAFDEWPVAFLTDYIVYVHHSYLKTICQTFFPSFESFVNGHLKKYPYLAQVKEVFKNLVSELKVHTWKEEESIFPYVKQISYDYDRKETDSSLFAQTMSRPIANLIAREHKQIASLIQQLREVTENYSFSAGACTNHRVIYQKLKEFDADLVQHKHLENNILFPKVLEMERSLFQI